MEKLYINIKLNNKSVGVDYNLKKDSIIRQNYKGTFCFYHLTANNKKYSTQNELIESITHNKSRKGYYDTNI